MLGCYLDRREAMSNVPPSVSVVIVTYNSSSYLSRCLAALRKQQVQLELIIVDNASRVEERPYLGTEDKGVVIFNSRNRGFAPAVNQGLEKTSAAYVLLLNPDVFLADNALSRLLTLLESRSDAAAVSPRVWWDVEQVALLPLTEVPTLPHLLVCSIVQRWRMARALYDRWKISQVRHGWFAHEAFAVPAVLGGCVLIPRRVLERIGPFDPRFPFYYEEVEWSLRARRQGYRLFVEPAAEAVHPFGHSRKGSRRVDRWAAVSARRYWRMRYGKLGARLVAEIVAHSEIPHFTQIDDLGEHAEPFTLGWGESTSPQVLEVAFDPLFSSTAAIFPVGREFRFPDALWSEMPPATYYARLLCGSELRPTRYWRWQRMPELGVQRSHSPQDSPTS
jgi:N-acetylglucosaminyl-diphospho-decaprenol L-rhamnosyltransferase